MLTKYYSTILEYWHAGHKNKRLIPSTVGTL